MVGHYSCGFMVMIWLASFCAYAQAQTLAFPTAEGFGRFSQGGRGGRVIYVTNRNASGPGSFRACLEAAGPRTCVFRVGGTIPLGRTDPGNLAVPPYLTIAGQTAAGDGIMVIGELFLHNTHDVIIRHLRIRPGVNVPSPSDSRAITIGTSQNIIVDHGSYGWSHDDIISISSSQNVTIQWSILSEGLSIHDQSKAAIIDGRGTDKLPGLVVAIARTWKTVEGKARKDLGTHMPRQYSQRTRVPRLPGAHGGKTFWRYSQRLGLRHIGDVTVVLRKKGRHLGPKYPQLLVTNLDEWTPRQVVCAYQRRWPVEQINRELKTDLGRGEHQGRTEEGRIEKSLGMAVLAYLLLIRVCHQQILPGPSWSIGQLQHTLRLRISTHQVEHNVKTRLTKARKVA